MVCLDQPLRPHLLFHRLSEIATEDYARFLPSNRPKALVPPGLGVVAGEKMESSPSEFTKPTPTLQHRVCIGGTAVSFLRLGRRQWKVNDTPGDI